MQVTTGRHKGKPPIRPRQSYGAPKIPAYVRGIVGRYQCTNCTTSTQRLNLGLLKLWKFIFNLKQKLMFPSKILEDSKVEIFPPKISQLTFIQGNVFNYCGYAAPIQYEKMKLPCSYELLQKCLIHFNFLPETGHNQWFNNENLPYLFQTCVYQINI